MSRRRSVRRAPLQAITMTPALREAFRLVPDDADCLGGRAWVGASHTTIVCRFRLGTGVVVRAKLRIAGEEVTRESLHFTGRLL